MEDRLQQQAKELLDQSDYHFMEAVVHQRLGAALFRQYQELMRPEWEKYTVGEGDGG